MLTLRVLLGGVMAGVLGFCYATIVYGVSRQVPGNFPGASRGVGTQLLTFTNPFVDGAGSDRDLGDVELAGTIPVERYVRAKGGLLPYTFSAGSLAAALPGLSLAANGRLYGQAAALGSTIFRFDTTVTDSFVSLQSGSANTRTEPFRLRFVNDATFRFAVSALSTPLSYQGYADKLEVINGAPPYRYTVSAISLNGKVLTTLEQIGLVLSTDGLLYGRALEAGTLAFTAGCTDSAGRVAYSRDGATFGQRIELQIEDSRIVSSQIAALDIKLQRAKVPGLSYKGFVNLNGQRVASLAGAELELRIGPYRSPPITLDAKGRTAKLAKGTLRQIRASLNLNGQLKVQIKDPELVSSGLLPAFEKISTSADRRSAVFVRLGGLVAESEAFSFGGGTSTRGSRYYSLRRYGGMFALVSVTGNDSKFANATRWKAKALFDRIYAYDETEDDLDRVSYSRTTISIGADFTESSNDVIWMLRGNSYSIKTGEIASSGDPGKQTGIPKAGSVAPGTRSQFGLHVDFVRRVKKTTDVPFTAEASTAIFAKGRNWSSKLPRR